MSAVRRRTASAGRTDDDDGDSDSAMAQGDARAAPRASILRRPGDSDAGTGASTRGRVPSTGCGDASADPTTLRCLSYNVWDTPVVAHNRAARIKAFCKLLSTHGPDGLADTVDVIGLQENFMRESFDRIAEAGREGGLRYSHRFLSGIDLPARADGAGISLLSRYPISEVCFFPYSVNGHWQKLVHWDFQTGKGVGMARISTPSGSVDVYVSHLVAQYTDADNYEKHRIAQAFECGHFMRLTRRSPLSVLLTDMNANPGSRSYAVLAGMSRHEDSFTDANDGASTVTWGGSDSTFANRSHPIFTEQPCDRDQRLDYCMYHIAPPSDTHIYALQARDGGPNPGMWRLRRSNVAMHERYPDVGGETTHLSDHYGMYAEFVCDGEAAFPVDPAVSGSGGGGGTTAEMCSALDPVPRNVLSTVVSYVERGADEAERGKQRRIVQVVVSLVLALLVFEGGLLRSWGSSFEGPFRYVSGIPGDLPMASGALMATMLVGVPIGVFAILVRQKSRVVLFGGAGLAVASLLTTAYVVVSRDGWPAVAITLVFLLIPFALYQALQAFGPQSSEVRRMRALTEAAQVMLGDE